MNTQRFGTVTPAVELPRDLDERFCFGLTYGDAFNGTNHDEALARAVERVNTLRLYRDLGLLEEGELL